MTRRLDLSNNCLKSLASLAKFTALKELVRPTRAKGGRARPGGRRRCRAGPGRDASGERLTPADTQLPFVIDPRQQRPWRGRADLSGEITRPRDAQHQQKSDCGGRAPALAAEEGDAFTPVSAWTGEKGRKGERDADLGFGWHTRARARACCACTFDSAKSQRRAREPPEPEPEPTPKRAVAFNKTLKSERTIHGSQTP